MAPWLPVPIADQLDRQLQAHPLSHFFKLRSGDIKGADQNSTTSKRLRLASSRLSATRTPQLREKLTKSAIEDAMKAGLSVCLVGYKSRAVDKFQAENKDNGFLQYAESDEFNQLSRPCDRILAPSLADRLTHDELKQFVSRAASLLSASGCLTLSSFAPHHLGLGWKIICEKQAIHCHREEDLAAIAAAAELSFTKFHDASGSLAWIEMKKPHSKFMLGGKHNAG